MAAKTITYGAKCLPMDFVARSTGRRIPVVPGQKLKAGDAVAVELPSGREGEFKILESEIEDLARHPDFGGPVEAQPKEPVEEEPAEEPEPETLPDTPEPVQDGPATTPKD